MLLTQNSIFSSPLVLPFKHYHKKIEVPSFGINHDQKNKFIRSSRSGTKLDAYTSINSASHHPSQLKLPSTAEFGHGGEIGIDNFFKGKNAFLTGATGLLGKALVEKLLRSTSVGKIYILVKASDEEAAFDRLTKEITGSDLFECLREKHGSSYEEFVRTRLIPIVGNICAPNIGMDANSAHTSMEEVDVILQSAASTTLNGRYDELLDVNVNAPQRLMRFAKTCKKLKLFVHISTAYVNGEREGVIYEEPLIMGQNGRHDNEEMLFPLDLTHEMSLAMKQRMASTNFDANKDLKKLGIERASYYGWYNTYTMSKALGEMAINEIKQDVPLVIIRPSIIESTYKDPFPGWILGNRMFDPVIISYGKGHLPAFLANPQVILDIIPVDMVVNTIIGATAKHGNQYKSGEVNVYSASSSVINPLSFGDAFDYLYHYFKVAPLVDSQTINKIKFFDKFNDFSKYTRQQIFGRTHKSNGEDDKKIRKIHDQCNAVAAYAEQMCKIYEFAGFFRARFNSSNTLKLKEEMSEEEQLNFEVDARNIDWKKYFQEIHVPGLLKYLISDN